MSLEKERQWYQTYRKKLDKKYNGQVIVIKNEKVIGSYESYLEAFERTMRMHEIGTFFVRHCEARAA